MACLFGTHYCWVFLCLYGCCSGYIVHGLLFVAGCCYGFQVAVFVAVVGSDCFLLEPVGFKRGSSRPTLRGPSVRPPPFALCVHSVSKPSGSISRPERYGDGPRCRCHETLRQDLVGDGSQKTWAAHNHESNQDHSSIALWIKSLAKPFW